MFDQKISELAIRKPKWQWTKIKSQLKTRIDGKIVRVFLQSSMKFINKDNQSNSKLSTKISIDTQKSLQYQTRIGWNWHKSSNLPNISLKIEVKDQQKDSILLCPNNIQVLNFQESFLIFLNILQFQAKIYAVKIVVNSYQRDQTAYLEDVGIRGNNRIQLNEGCGYFTGIRFSSTSYNNQGVKFYLLVVISFKEKQGSLSNIIGSFLSPAIFVDSRKSARDYQGKRFHSFVELFPPQSFDKNFIKRQTKIKNQIQISINNSFDGLFNYLTAPNIRHKVKHPLFLAAKFSTVFKIYLNINHESIKDKQIKIDDAITKMQRRLIRQIGGEKRIKKCQNINKRLFVINITGSHSSSRRTKIIDTIEYLDCHSVYIAQKAFNPSQQFIDITKLGDIGQAYQQEFSNLEKLSNKELILRKNKQKINNDLENQGERDSSQKQINSLKKELMEQQFQNLKKIQDFQDQQSMEWKNSECCDAPDHISGELSKRRIINNGTYVKVNSENSNNINKKIKNQIFGKQTILKRDDYSYNNQQINKPLNQIVQQKINPTIHINSQINLISNEYEHFNNQLKNKSNFFQINSLNQQQFNQLNYQHQNNQTNFRNSMNYFISNNYEANNKNKMLITENGIYNQFSEPNPFQQQQQINFPNFDYLHKQKQYLIKQQIQKIILENQVMKMKIYSNQIVIQNLLNVYYQGNQRIRSQAGFRNIQIYQKQRKNTTMNDKLIEQKIIKKENFQL